MQGQAGAKEHLDAVDLLERNGDVTAVMDGLRVVEADAVDQRERLAERATHEARSRSIFQKLPNADRRRTRWSERSRRGQRMQEPNSVRI